MNGAVGRSRQLFLDLAHRPALGREDFLVNACNADAVDWVDRWPDWPVPALAVHGPPASGKSHLIHVWRARSGAQLIDGPGLVMARVGGILEGKSTVAIEAGDRVADEQALLHVYNWVVERKGTLMFSAGRPPSQWKVSLPDLASRLATVAAAGIEPPDDELLGGLLLKHFDERQIRIREREDVVRYLLSRMERTFAAAHDLARRLDELSLAEGRAITVPLARSALESEIKNR